MCQSKGYKKGNRILSYYARLSLVNFFEPIPPYKRKPFFQEDLLNPSITFYVEYAEISIFTIMHCSVVYKR